MPDSVISGISPGFPELSQSQGQVAHVLLTRSPLIPPEGVSPFDLHVLSTPPAFVLSQDQTLRRCHHWKTPKNRRAQKTPRRTNPHPTKAEADPVSRMIAKRPYPSQPKEPPTRQNQDTNHTTASTQPTPQTEVKLGINFWHAVEFSRSGRTQPTKAFSAARRGNPSSLGRRALEGQIRPDQAVGDLIALCW